MGAAISNEHISKYLEHYLSLTEPGFAVMINGPWGIGKTYLTKNILEKLGCKYEYISLYGLSKIEDIDIAFLLAVKGREWFWTQLGKSSLKYFKIDLNINLNDKISKNTKKILVFDDLERCEMSIASALGYINSLVEVHGNKAIVIANEIEILDKKNPDKDYLRKREKTIGKVLEIESQLDEALTFFIKKNHANKNALNSKRSLIEAVYKQSEINNLRILYQTICDFCRLYNCLDDIHLKNNDAIDLMTQIFFVFSMEFKMGRIERDDILQRSSWRDIKNIDDILTKYPNIKLRDAILTDAILEDIIVKGVCDSEKIKDCLNQSSFFVNESDEPAWRTLWYYLDRSDKAVEIARKKLDLQIKNKEITDIGVILHIFGLKLVFANIYNRDRLVIVNECKKFVDSLRRANKLKPTKLNNYDDNDAEDDFSFGSYEGLGFSENDTSEFKELAAYLEKARNLVRTDGMPKRASALLLEMQQNPDLFIRRLIYTNSSENFYAFIPILVYVNVNSFVDNFLKLNPSHQRLILVALNERHGKGNSPQLLKAEVPWLIKLYKKLSLELLKLKPLPRYRLLKGLNWGLKAIVDNANKKPKE
ncbi:MAG: hypothetical protein EOP52_13740 [Sphingobacteriales bacterium]|nr:MAG: hypothetical protein EOP52_13740 [Sphingobacteriales bacterium]